MIDNKKVLVSVVAATISLAALFSSTRFATDLLWFQSVGSADIFWTVFYARAITWVAVFLIFFVAIYSNLLIALFSTRNQRLKVHPNLVAGLDLNSLLKSGAVVVSLLVALVSSGSSAGLWNEFLKFANSTPFGISDPIFGRDTGFYFFSLPFLTSIKNIFILMMMEALVVSGVVYLFKGSLELIRGWHRNFGLNARRHLGVLLVIILALLAVHFYMLGYGLLFSHSGVVFGAGYTDVHTRLTGYYVISGSLLVVAGLVIFYIFSGKIKPLFFSSIGFGIIFLLFTVFIPAFEQKFIVEPNELEKEKEYIGYNIEFTRKAYGLDQVARESYDLGNTLTKKDLRDNRSTFQNIRLWDWRPLLSSYRQLQELRMYYTFEDVDIDRYIVDGEYRQMMLSVRELDYEQMPGQAKTWINQRLRYTHGFGLVASPVDTVTREGMPELLVKDIPPVGPSSLRIDRAGIYFGEKTNDYIFTGTSMEEFDYPLGEKNSLTRYNGKGGVAIDSFWKRLLYAIDNKSIKILISTYFTKETRILYNRNINTIVNKLAPYLKFDADPYIAIVDGQLKWIIDGYTIGREYPYAEPVERHVNYIRNSVKVVIDAYDGTPDFYIMDEADPVIQTYSKIFPGFFKKASEVPLVVRNQFRYPIDLFVKQSSIFLAYHMTEPEVFYNREDLWKFPREVYQGREEIMEPYYTIMQLDQKEAQFLLILPFTPANKNNMIAWLSAGSDGENYGKLRLYEFPKQELVYGPMQIEARIDQTPEISEVLTLWNQQGSSVIRGNLLVIPINHTLLYVEPLYLQAEKSKMPELKRVIVSHKDQIVMKPTLDEALEALFNVSNLSAGKEAGIDQNVNALINRAVSEFGKGNAALQQGDWAAYGRHQKEVEALLREIQRKSAGN